MTVIGSQTLQAMRIARYQIKGGLLRMASNEDARDWLEGALEALNGAIAREEAGSDPRVEVLARVLEPAAFDDPQEGWTPAQQAELRDATMAECSVALCALDAYEADNPRGGPTNAELLDAQIGR